MESIDSTNEAMASVVILGIRDARIDDLEGVLSLLRGLGRYQLMDAGLILNEDHVRYACFEALRSFEHGDNIAATPQMEILLRAAATTQISEAITRLGAGPESRELVLVSIHAGEGDIDKVLEATRGVRSEAVLLPSTGKRERIKEVFGVGEPLERTLFERIALISAG